MPLPSTMTPIATQTLTAAATSISFSNIPQGYTDLIMVYNCALTAAGGGMKFQVNGDTGTNYSWTFLQGNGTTVVSGRASADNKIAIPPWQSQVGTTNNSGVGTLNLQNYSNTTTYKTAIAKGGDGGFEAATHVGLWRNTSAITSITILNQGGTSIKENSTFTIYGIKAA